MTATSQRLVRSVRQPCLGRNGEHTERKTPSVTVGAMATTTPAPAPSASRPRPTDLVRTVFRRGPAQRTLHLTWLAFFLSFVVWFSFAPFATTIGGQLGLDAGQLVTLGLCNLALTVPARLLIGGILDRFGPRRTFAGILVYALVPCLLFATADSFEMLIVSRLLISVVGAGFVVGIRMVAEWFPPAEVGTAEGVYGGWGNFGAAAATLGLPVVAGLAGGTEGWRWAAAVTGVVAAAYGLAYVRLVHDTPDGVPYVRARSAAALEVTSRRAVLGLVAMLVAPALALALIAFRIWKAGVIGTTAMVAGFLAAGVWFGLQVLAVRKVNQRALADGVPEAERYPFRSVVVLSLAYSCTFGSELAAVSHLPHYFETTWGLSTAVAGAAASAFAVMNLVTRPLGGVVSDLVASRRRWLAVLLGGLAVGFVAMSWMSGAWPLGAAIALVLLTSVFAQAGNGAVYAIVPLVHPKAGGQIAGMAGAYGNVGGIVFLSTLVLFTPTAFFLVMAGASALALVACRWLVEPTGGHATVLAPAAPVEVDIDLGGEEAVGRSTPAVGLAVLGNG